jgi:predicted Zn-dependent protease
VRKPERGRSDTPWPKRWRRGGALVVLAAFVAGCGLLSRREVALPELAPEPPKRRTILATEADDARAGEEAEKQAIAELGVLRDEGLQRYVQEVGARVAAHAPTTGFEYRFQVVDPWTPNAFALPGGAIFVSRGLLALTNSEDELANVLAHEIVHVARRHAAAQQLVAQATPFAFGWWGAGQIAAYARDQEREADEAGQRFAAAAGYDPAAMSSLLRGLEQEERIQLGASRLPSFLQHHPANTERMALAFSRGSELRWQPRPGVSGDREGHLRRLEGLIVDANPAEGIFVGSRYLHPDLGFALSFPDGWRLLNTTRMVAAFSPRGKARFALEGAGAGDDPRVAAGAFLAVEARQLGAEILSAQSLEIAGRPAYEVRAQIWTPQGAMAGQLTWIAHEDLLYRISASAPASAAGRFFGRGRALARSFRSITEQEREEIRAERLRIASARAGEDLSMLSRRTGNAWDPARTAVLNGLLPGTPLSDGQLLKIVVSERYEGPPAEVSGTIPRSDPERPARSTLSIGGVTGPPGEDVGKAPAGDLLERLGRDEVLEGRLVAPTRYDQIVGGSTRVDPSIHR